MQDIIFATWCLLTPIPRGGVPWFHWCEEHGERKGTLAGNKRRPEPSLPE